VTVGSGGTEAIGDSGGTTAEGGGALLSQEEWQSLTAPISGPHEIWTYDSCDPPHAGSDSARVEERYSVIPSVGMTAPDFDPETNAVYFAVLMDYCTTAADCTDEPDGVCEGFIGDAYCEYSEPLPPDLCWVDEECTRRAEGSCVLPVGPYAFTVCYPTGVCAEPTGKCVYAGDTPCTGDADCSEAADGRCVFPVDTRCDYNSCFDDGDCDEGTRCGCGDCLLAECDSNEDCGDGETCELSPTMCHTSRGFYCTTPEDECEVGDPVCDYRPYGDGGYWSASGDCILK